MNRLNDLPCINVQNGPLLLACNAMHPEGHANIGGRAHVSDCTYLGEDDDEMERLFRANGSLATITFSDSGNGWASIRDMQAKTDEDAIEFVNRLWTEAFDNADNKVQHRQMMSKTISSCSKEGACTCAVKFAPFIK